VIADPTAQIPAGESDERVRWILDSITDGFLGIDAEWRVVYANRRAREILGRELTWSGQTLWEMFPQVVGSEFERSYRAAVETGEPCHFDAFFAPHRRWYEIHAYPSPAGLSIYFRDVTRRRAAAEALRERDTRFELVARATQDLIYELELTGADSCAVAVETVFGFSPPQVARPFHVWLDQVHGDDLESLTTSLDRALRCGDALWSAEYRVASGGEGWTHILDRGTIVRGVTGVPLRLIGARMDITARKEAEEEIRSSREQARSLAREVIELQEKERARIARDIHDVLGQALTAIKIDAVSLGRNAGVEDVVRRRAKRISDVVDETVRAVREMSTRLRPIALDDLGLVDALTAEARAFSERTSIACEVRGGVRSLRLDGDVSTAIFRIVQEALTNVARHSDARQVAIDLRRTAGQLHVEVRDDGRGIAGHPPAASLGLLGMKERALLIGGEFAIERGERGGTVVSVRVPYSSTASLGESPDSQRGIGRGTSGPTDREGLRTE
jgi:two-component system sensor histidine kinase UhpB